MTVRSGEKSEVGGRKSEVGSRTVIYNVRKLRRGKKLEVRKYARTRAAERVRAYFELGSS